MHTEITFSFINQNKSVMAVAPPSLWPVSGFTTNMNKDAEPRKKEEKYGKIPFSDVVVKPSKRAQWHRKWNLDDVIHVLVVLSMHVLSLFAPFNFDWGAFKLTIVLYIVTGLFGVTLSYHRQLSHGSFKLRPKWLEYMFAYFALHALQGDPIEWVSNHRFHHKYTDTDRDVHSPIEGFWFSHINWLFNYDYIAEKCGKRNNVEDLRKQRFYRFLENTSLLHPLALGILFYIYGGFPYIAWGMGARITWGYHMTFLVNSACHIWGYQAWNTGDLSKNNWFVTLFVFGEGWHNNHHAFEYSARHGIERWEIDLTWYVIRLFEYIGMARDVKVPSETHKRKLSFNNGGDGAKVLPDVPKHRIPFRTEAE